MRQDRYRRADAMLRIASIAGLLLAGALWVLPRAAMAQVALVGTSGAVTGAFTPSDDGTLTSAEFAGQDGEDGPNGYAGNIVNRTFAKGNANGVSVNSGKKTKSNPQFNAGFEGLNHYQQRYARGGNQFSVEPPDQGMCVGNGYVLEAVNDVLNIFDTAGNSVLPDNTATNIVSGFPRDVNHAVDLNSFYGYAPAINRAHGNIRGQFVTDPSCLYDAATQRWFVVVLTLETVPTNGAFTTVNHLDIAVSQTANPTGGWNIYRLDVTNDGSPGDSGGPCPCLGDYPHIGADAYGFYITTNSFPWGPGDFDGAQIYALSKAQLAAGAASVTMQHFDTTGMVQLGGGSTQPGFTVWPAQSPGTDSFNLNNGGTEYLLSSNAVFSNDNSSTQLVLWTLSNTSSLNSGSPAVTLNNRIVAVNQYGVPPKAQQPGSGNAPGTDAPQGYCLDDLTTVTIAGTGCWRLLVTSTAHAATFPEVISRLDANDSRMQQVMYANGKLWGALDTALNPDGTGNRAGIAWYILNPSSGKVVLQGYLGTAGMDFTYPAIGVTASGRGIMAFTAVGDATDPSAAYASIDAIAGVGAWNIVTGGTGAAPQDGFSGYKAQNFPNRVRPRWGDYGAAAVDGNSIWIASEYIGGACGYTDWGGPFFAGGAGDNLLGTCGGASHGPGVRTALANWATRISKLTP